MTTNDGGPAFPMPAGPEPRVNATTHFNEGMSLRDWFAGMALQGLIASGEWKMWFSAKAIAGSMRPEEALGNTNDMMACTAYTLADAMLAERAKAKE